MVNGYKIVKLLGRGGQGAAYQVERKGRSYVVKVLVRGPEESDDDWKASVVRINREYAVLKSLDHPNVVKVHTAEMMGAMEVEDGGLPFLVMSHVEGTHLNTWIKQNRPPLRAILMVMTNLASALQAVHAVGVGHRDVKSSNILIQNDTHQPFLIDFGMVRISHGITATKRGFLAGTASHFAPEFIQNQTKYFKESDTYSLGYTLYFALTGKSPYAVPEDADVSDEVMMTAALKAPIRRPQDLNSYIPDELADVLVQLLDKNPKVRMTCSALEATCRQWIKEPVGSTKWDQEFLVPAVHGGATRRHGVPRSPRELVSPLPATPSKPSKELPAPERRSAPPARESKPVGSAQAIPVSSGAIEESLPQDQSLAEVLVPGQRVESSRPSRPAPNSRPSKPPAAPSKPSRPSHPSRVSAAPATEPMLIEIDREPEHAAAEADPNEDVSPLTALERTPRRTPKRSEMVTDLSVSAIVVPRKTVPSHESAEGVQGSFQDPHAEAAPTPARESGPSFNLPSALRKLPAGKQLDSSTKPKQSAARIALAALGAMALLTLVLPRLLAKPTTESSTQSLTQKLAETEKTQKELQPAPLAQPQTPDRPALQALAQVDPATTAPAVPSGVGALAPKPTSGSGIVSPKAARPRGVDAQQVDKMLEDTYGGRPRIGADGRPVVVPTNNATPPSNNQNPTKVAMVTPDEDNPYKVILPFNAPPPDDGLPKPLGIPTGEHLHVRLITNLDSRTIGSGYVEAVLTMPVIIGDTTRLPRGTKLYGKASGSGDRFTIKFDNLRMANNREVAFSGLAVDHGERKPGLPASRSMHSAANQGDSLATQVVKGAANTGLNQVQGGPAQDLARGAGTTVVNAQDNQTGGSSTVILLDAPYDFDVFVEKPF